MKAVILAGGYGTRLSEETSLKPKPLIEIGDKPILWHIMKIYSDAGINDFIICCGYKGQMIKEYFANYSSSSSDIVVNMKEGSLEVLRGPSEPWIVTVVDTGIGSMTGGRLKKVSRYLDEGQSFCFTYGDGLANLDIQSLVKFHHSHGRLATVTAVRPPARFGALDLDPSGTVKGFVEKPLGDNSWINGGFFVLENAVIDLIESNETVWEEEPLARLSAEGHLTAYRHEGFWQPMDTMRDKRYLNQLWDEGRAPWKLW